MIWKELKIGECFKFAEDHVTYYKKIKLGRKHVFISMTGGFSFLPPTGLQPQAIIYKTDQEGNLIGDL